MFLLFSHVASSLGNPCHSTRNSLFPRFLSKDCTVQTLSYKYSIDFQRGQEKYSFFYLHGLFRCCRPCSVVPQFGSGFLAYMFFQKTRCTPFLVQCAELQCYLNLNYKIATIKITLLSGVGMEVHPVTVFTPLFTNSLHPKNIAAQILKIIILKNKNLNMV